jgi:hypothetical protein
MKTLVLLLALVASCATPGGLDPISPDPIGPGPQRRYGDIQVGGQQCKWATNLPTVAGATTDNIVFTTTAQGDSIRNTFPGLQRVLVHFRGDQGVTVKYQTLAPLPTTTWRTMNGAGSGDVVGANTDYATDFLVLGPDVRIDVLTGGAAPTGGGELAVELCNDRVTGQ